MQPVNAMRYRSDAAGQLNSMLDVSRFVTECNRPIKGGLREVPWMA